MGCMTTRSPAESCTLIVGMVYSPAPEFGLLYLFPKAPAKVFSERTAAKFNFSLHLHNISHFLDITYIIYIIYINFIYITYMIYISYISPISFTSPTSSTSTSSTSTSSTSHPSSTSPTIYITYIIYISYISYISPISFTSPTTSTYSSTSHVSSASFYTIYRCSTSTYLLYKLLQCHLHGSCCIGIVSREFIHRSSYTGVVTQELASR